MATDFELLSDEALAQQAGSGVAGAFKALVDRFRLPLINYLYRMVGNRETAQEVAQEAFVRVYKNLSVYNPKRSFATWIYFIASNLAKNAIRDDKYFADISLDKPIFDGGNSPRLIDIIEDPEADTRRIMEDEELSDEAQKVLDTLPIKYKEVIILCGIQGLTYKEASSILRCSIPAVGLRYQKARAMFIKRIGIRDPKGKAR